MNLFRVYMKLSLWEACQWVSSVQWLHPVASLSITDHPSSPVIVITNVFSIHGKLTVASLSLIDQASSMYSDDMIAFSIHGMLTMASLPLVDQPSSMYDMTVLNGHGMESVSSLS